MSSECVFNCSAESLKIIPASIDIYTFIKSQKEEDIIECEYTVEEAIQYIISAGIVQPDKKDLKELGAKDVSV